jgi:type I restriction enzyme S subunit
VAEVWPTVTLEAVALDVTVGHVGPMADEYLDAGVPFLRSLSVEPFGIRKEGLKYISPEFHKKLKKSALSPGDVVIVRTGKPGTCAVVPDWLGTANCSDLVVVRCGPSIRPHFLCYVVNSVAGEHIEAHTVGAVQQHFNVGSARTLKFLLPPLKEQDRILALLRGLDDKIELNRRMNKTLEAMARALFRDWFVDFGPTRAKMAGQAPYLSPALWDLVPASLDAEGKPEGWTASTIGEEVRVVGGSTPSTAEAAFWDGTLNWATPKDLSNLSTPVLLETSRKITKAGLGKISSGLLPVGTVLLSSRAPIGYLAIAEVPVAINQGFIAMICDKRLSNVFVWLWTLENMEAILSKANGSTFQEISKGNFRPLPVVLPDAATLEAFVAQAKPLYARIAQNERETRTLAQTRDLLLPRLMSGELRMTEAGQILAGVA